MCDLSNPSNETASPDDSSHPDRQWKPDKQTLNEHKQKYIE